MLPTFFVIGAAKCGTTTLCQSLALHPRVFMSDPKEIHYFGRDDSQKTRAWYEKHFEAAGPYDAVGEGSTSYTHPDIIERCAAEIAAAVPDARLVYMVRNPLRRLESDWKMRKHEGWAPPGSINAAVEDLGSSLVRHGRYWDNLEVYRRHFSDDQLLVIFLEDFARTPEPELARCCRHIGVDPALPVASAGIEANRSGDFRRDVWGAGWLRRSGLVSRLRTIVPRPLFNLARSAFTRPDRFEVRWEPSARAAVLDALVEDSRSFLEHCGKPPDFWTYS